MLKALIFLEVRVNLWQIFMKQGANEWDLDLLRALFNEVDMEAVR